MSDAGSSLMGIGTATGKISEFREPCLFRIKYIHAYYAIEKINITHTCQSC